MTPNKWITIGAIFGGTAVALGAFGAHALKGAIEPRMLEVFQTAVRYQMFHVVAFFVTGVLYQKNPTGVLEKAGYCFLFGTLAFSLSLYALSLSGIKWLGAITPLGGVLLMIGWFLLTLYSIKNSSRGNLRS